MQQCIAQIYQYKHGSNKINYKFITQSLQEQPVLKILTSNFKPMVCPKCTLRNLCTN